MGRLEAGKWTDAPAATDKKGRFLRKPSSFRKHVTADGSSGFRAEAGRYHLYASWACPWAHRVLIVRRLRKLDDVISVAIPSALYGAEGWVFVDEPGAVVDSVNGFHWLHEAYTAGDPSYTGRVTVPLLWDKEQKTVVNNESREIIRMLDTAFLGLGDPNVSFRPAELAESIDRTIDDIFQPINNGVYRAGFARTQEAYDEAVKDVFEALDRYDALLGKQRYLCGDVLTEADWCLFTTLVRFEPVYHYHFKCNVRRLRDYPNLWSFTKELYQVPGVAEVTNLNHIRRHYYQSHESINPHRIVPAGPDVDFLEEHDRDQKFPRSS